MERKHISEVIVVEFDRCSVTDFISRLDAIEKEALAAGFPMVEVEFFHEWDSAELRVIRSRLETNEEFEQRYQKERPLNEFEKFLKKVDGASIPTECQLQSTKFFFDRLPTKINGKLTISLNADGEVVFKITSHNLRKNYSAKGFHLDLGIGMDNRVSYYAHVTGIGRFYAHDLDPFSPLPENILKYFSN
jgi:hypothetical protein